MSMNLCFVVKNSDTIMDFPFQTPTKLTYAVLAAKTPEAKRKLICKHMNDVKWTAETKKIMLDRFDALMASPNLQLYLI